MNGVHHRSLIERALQLDGYSLDEHADLIRACAEADYVQDVTAEDLPFLREFPGTWSAFCHFQRADGSGYLWASDPSLGALGVIGEAAMQMAGAHVHGTSEPMKAACLIQQGRVLADFRFPSAARMTSLGGGIALHVGMDCCIPQHVWLALLYGHQRFEDTLQASWERRLKVAKLASEPAAFLDGLREACDRERITATTLDQLCRDNAAWTLDRFGKPRELAECAANDELAICVRAIASTRRGLEIMKGAA